MKVSLEKSQHFSIVFLNILKYLYHRNHLRTHFSLNIYKIEQKNIVGFFQVIRVASPKWCQIFLIKSQLYMHEEFFLGIINLSSCLWVAYLKRKFDLRSINVEHVRIPYHSFRLIAFIIRDEIFSLFPFRFFAQQLTFLDQNNK